MAQAITPAALVYAPLAPRAIACAHDVIRPETCLHGGAALIKPGASLVLDFGEELVGVIELTVEADAATTVELIEGEDLEEALLINDPFPPDHWYHQPRDVLRVNPGGQTLRNQGRRAFRYVNLLVHGPGTLRLHGARAILEHAPVTDRGAFLCSDPLLNDAWAISQRTIRLCMQGFYEDGVKRDGMLWIGDYRVEFLCAHHLFADTALARRSLEMFARCRHANGSLSAVALDAGGHLYPRISYLGDLSAHGGLHEWVLDNYCADFVSSVWEYVLHTGDAALARTLAPVTRGVLDYLARVDLGTAVPGRAFITDNQPETKDWWGSRATLGFQLAAAFRDAARLADLLGDPTLATHCRQWQAGRLRETVERFGNPASAAARDDRPDDATRSWHAHAAAFLAGAIDAAQLRAIYPRLRADPAVRRPMAGFMEFYLLQSWLGAGLVHEALDEMRSYYGQMLSSGATTTWELVDRREPGIDHIQPAGRSHCHGWSAGPAFLLPVHILGIAPTSPGYRTVDLRPTLGDLAWAHGVAPTPHGDIRVVLTGSSSGSVELPEGITATLHLPEREPVTLAAGRHSFSISGS
ncbi:MAG: family 78 glycoside hydrolase catalytic domain [Opitutaceae bacterium]|nr:family 78 glycoside hydrolase catalytic domain [Opitutaceae bacterium]